MHVNKINPQQPVETLQSSSDPYSPTMISVVVGIVLIAALVGWYFYSGAQEESQVTSGEQSTGLGAELFADVDNPIEGQIPTVQTTVNPIKEIYKNPFE